MGQRAVIVVVEKDHAGGGATVPATLYEVDLDDPSGNEVHQALRRHLQKLATGKTSARTSGDAATVRRWARKRHLPVSTRGRIPAQIMRQYYDEVEKGSQQDTEEDNGEDTVADAINRAAECFGENVICIGDRWQQRGYRGGN